MSTVRRNGLLRERIVPKRTVCLEDIMPRTAASRARKSRISVHYTRWSKREVRELRQLAHAKMPMPDIGRKLGRTEISIRGKAQREGISLARGDSGGFSRRARRTSR